MKEHDFIIKNTYEIKTFQEYLDKVDNYRDPDQDYIFRGQGVSANRWPLNPKALRRDFFERDDSFLLNYWWREVSMFFEKTPTTKWEMLFMAQHYGFPTRLLDWTFNPLIAMYFSLGISFWEKPLQIIGQEDYPSVYVTKFPGSIKIDDGANRNPFHEYGSVLGIYPLRLDQRISSQESFFTWHGKKELDEEDKLEIEELKILLDEKEGLDQLNYFGVNSIKLFASIEKTTNELVNRLS